MSWYVDGREYHNYARYQSALNNRRQRDLRHLLQEIRDTPVDTSTADRSVVDQVARARTLERHQRALHTAIQAEQARAQQMGDRIDAVARQDLAALEAMGRELEATSAELSSALAASEARMDEARADVAASLAGEARIDAAQAAQATTDADADIASAMALLGQIDTATASAMQVDVGAARALLATAANAPEASRSALAHRVRRAAQDALITTQRRSAHVQGAVQSLMDEVARQRARLSFDPEDREDIVGDLDAPLRRALDQLEQRIRSVQSWDSYERRLAAVEADLNAVSSEVEAMATLVQDFDALEDARVALITTELASRLTATFGQAVSLSGVEEGALGMQPVEARYRTAQGERIDVTVDIDGSLRIHHHGHPTTASCHDAAADIATRLDALMAVEATPKRDIVAPPTPRAGRLRTLDEATTTTTGTRP